MSKHEKRIGKVRPRHKPLPDVPRREPLPAKRGPRHVPRYVVEAWWRWWNGAAGGWARVGAARDLDEAKHLRLRVHPYGYARPVRIIDTTTGAVVWSETLQPAGWP